MARVARGTMVGGGGKQDMARNDSEASVLGLRSQA